MKWLTIAHLFWYWKLYLTYCICSVNDKTILYCHSFFEKKIWVNLKHGMWVKMPRSLDKVVHWLSGNAVCFFLVYSINMSLIDICFLQGWVFFNIDSDKTPVKTSKRYRLNRSPTVSVTAGISPIIFFFYFGIQPDKAGVNYSSVKFWDLNSTFTKNNNKSTFFRRLVTITYCFSICLSLRIPQKWTSKQL